ncbi:HAMP domain-containing sensor histidine kinase [Jeotgalibacillus sp. ET6]|uniref:sensor histidine kinase n=1 Tax=Jeotgalibacillus sp. ET6 TaxID=3037260 RepID=UPI00241892D9|nr:HAMP domain-containing sensor histidine kinase [Jeotgalibacillus sp. ET6]MDG5473148.1 HAMP domain-containing sensor histidine kinase [Jeotgalibacillus sp. ET6]
MLNSLYLRMVVTFLAVVISSVTISFMITYNMYETRVMNELEEEMMLSGQTIIKLYNELEPESLEGYLESVSSIRYNIALFTEDGEASYYGRARQENYADPDEITKVLSGDVHRVENEDRRLLKNASVGLPFEADGENYALFLKPGINGRLNLIEEALMTVLLSVLLIGSALYLLVALYLVTPIKKLTLYTSKIAQGNFTGHVPVRRKDEIGELAKSFHVMNNELNNLETMRREFISNVSHDFQSPLTSIRGFAVALKENEFTKEQQDHYLTIIQKESERLAKLSENVLKLSVLESKENPLNKEMYRVDKQIRHVFLTHQPQWLEKGIHIHLEDLKPIEWFADKDQFEQVWHNLLINSLKFVGTGGEIKAALEEGEEFISVIFSDTGAGIPEEDLPHVFDRFFTVDRARVRSKQGSGLGLAIVKKIIDLHEGDIQVASRENEGTAFMIKLPKK